MSLKATSKGRIAIFSLSLVIESFNRATYMDVTKSVDLKFYSL